MHSCGPIGIAQEEVRRRWPTRKLKAFAVTDRGRGKDLGWSEDEVQRFRSSTLPVQLNAPYRRAANKKCRGRGPLVLRHTDCGMQGLSDTRFNSAWVSNDLMEIWCSALQLSELAASEDPRPTVAHFRAVDVEADDQEEDGLPWDQVKKFRVRRRMSTCICTLCACRF